MNKDNAKQYLPLVQALAEGKTIQFNYATSGWMDVDDINFAGPVKMFRIKPEPKLRPWKPEEVPVGAVVMFRGWFGPSLLVSADRHTASWANQSKNGTDQPPTATYDELMGTDFKWKWPQEPDRAYRPCGIMEE